jgi:hypothetical protein
LVIVHRLPKCLLETTRSSRFAWQKRRPFMALFLVSVVVSTPAQTRKFKALHRFHGAPADGAFPWTHLTRDAAGNLYGMTEQGGNISPDHSSLLITPMQGSVRRRIVVVAAECRSAAQGWRSCRTRRQLVPRRQPCDLWQGVFSIHCER